MKVYCTVGRVQGYTPTEGVVACDIISESRLWKVGDPCDVDVSVFKDDPGCKLYALSYDRYRKSLDNYNTHGPVWINAETGWMAVDPEHGECRASLRYLVADCARMVRDRGREVVGCYQQNPKRADKTQAPAERDREWFAASELPCWSFKLPFGPVDLAWTLEVSPKLMRYSIAGIPIGLICAMWSEKSGWEPVESIYSIGEAVGQINEQVPIDRSVLIAGGGTSNKPEWENTMGPRVDAFMEGLNSGSQTKETPPGLDREKA